MISLEKEDDEDISITPRSVYKFAFLNFNLEKFIFKAKILPICLMMTIMIWWKIQNPHCFISRNKIRKMVYFLKVDLINLF